MPEWTASQKNAVESRDLDLIVSAGAGSGKTTVLTHRILERLKKGASVTDFLVVTFTRASAADLRDKLARAVGTLAAEHPEEKHYRTQLYLLPSARISTIHSFCFEIVRADFQALGLSPAVRIADEEEERMLASEVMEGLLDALYEEGGALFSLLSDTFSGTKDDAPLSETMLSLYDRLRAFDDYFGWLEKQRDRLFAEAEEVRRDLFSSRLGEKLREKLIVCFRELEEASASLAGYCAMYGGGSNMEEAAELLRERAALLKKACGKDYAGFLSAARASGKSGLPRLSAKGVPEEVKAYFTDERDRIRKELDRLAEEYDLGDAETVAKQYADTAKVLEAIRAFLTRFEEAFLASKRANAVMSFSDAEHFLLKLLEKDGEPTPLCLSLRKQIKEIFVDEYQDVSPLQDRIFRLLSRGGNRFMVGDVKQSIYRFRNAYPDIFLDYKDSFPDYPPQSGKTSARIFLRENFRSGRYILDFVNLLFRRITEGTPYKREYEGEELVFARKTDAEPLPVTVALSVYDRGGAGEAEQREADYIASEIRRLVESAYCESEDGPRRYRYGDVALLFRKLKNATKPYEDALKRLGIPYTVTKEQPFFEQPEILLALSVLKAIDDPTDDIALFSAMRSPAFGFDADELYRARLCSERGPFVRAVRLASEKEDALGEKCRAFLGSLEAFRELAEGRPCHEFLWELYTATGLPVCCGRQGKRNLLRLYEYARRFESGGYRGLSGFLAYLKAAGERGAEPLGAEKSPGNGDCVTLTTIHRSKGLEYPAVFLCGCGKPLFSHQAKPYTLLREDGLFFRLRDYDALTVTDTALNRYARMADRDAELGEELRKLYVACTRAKEKLYVVGSVTRTDLDRKRFHPRAPRSQLDLVLYAVTGESSPCFETLAIDDRELTAGDFPAVSVSADGQKDLLTEESFFTEEAESAVRFVYPYGESAVPAKVSVSELRRKDGAKLETAFSPGQLLVPPLFLTGTGNKPDPTEIGTANHVFLQFCDFGEVERNGVSAEADRLLEKKLLSEEQRAMLDPEGLRAFFESPLFARMKKSPRLYREQRFSVRSPASLLGGDPDETLLVQGVIDCFFEEPDGTFTVVDYKTDRVRSGKELADRHRAQLEQYRAAAERMTGKPVGRVLLWSFALGREVEAGIGTGIEAG